MSEIKERVQMFVESERTPTLFIHSVYDDLPLTVDAFRLLCHLSRRSGNESHIAQTTYERMAEACYRATWPNSTASALRKRAMAAMKELVGFGLVRVEATTGWDGGQGANRYILTHCTEWKPEYQPGPETTVRGTPVRPSGPPQSARADLSVVRPSGPPQSAPADPPSPPERTHKDIYLEGNPSLRIDPVRVGQEKEKPEPSDPNGQLSLLNQENPASELFTDPELNVPPPASQKVKVKTKKKTPKHHPEAFAGIYEEYRQFAKVTSPSIARNQSPSQAAEVWDSLLISGDPLEAILEGVRWYIQQELAAHSRGAKVFGVAHFFRYLKDRRWESSFQDKQEEQSKPQAPAQESTRLTSRLHAIRRTSDRIHMLLKALDKPAVLPENWQQKTGKVLVKDLSHEEAQEFCDDLERLLQESRSQAS